MDRSEFMSLAYKSLQSFETKWNRGQRSDDPDSWPNEMPEADWWAQLIMHIEEREYES